MQQTNKMSYGQNIQTRQDKLEMGKLIRKLLNYLAQINKKIWVNGQQGYCYSSSNKLWIVGTNDEDAKDVPA